MSGPYPTTSEPGEDLWPEEIDEASSLDPNNGRTYLTGNN